MSNSKNATDPTVDDPRVQHIAEVAGLEPADVLAHVAEDAAAEGVTVEQELETDSEYVELIEMLGGAENN